jgi:hypothetical protein
VGHACRCGAFFPLTFIPLTLSALSLSAAACTDETSLAVTRDVCYSEMRWVGEKRGSAEMYPGRDCVSCHIENDGPPLVLGGTVYAFIIADRARYFERQSGTDCFGLTSIPPTPTTSVAPPASACAATAPTARTLPPSNRS